MVRFPIPVLDGGNDYRVATGCSKHANLPFENRLAIMTLDALHISAHRALKGGSSYRALDIARKADGVEDTDLSDIATLLGLVDLSGESGGEDWVEFELDLAAILARGYFSIAKQMVISKLEPFLTAAGEVFDDVGWASAVEDARVDLNSEIDRVLVPAIGKSVRETVSYGESRVVTGILSGSNKVPAVVDALTGSTAAYAKGFLTSYVVPAVEREIAETLKDGPLARPNLQPILETLNEMLQDDVYWRIVANATASRSFHYGFTKAAQAQGYQTVVFSAIIDRKTSIICQELNGTRWHIADFVTRYEAEAEAQTTEDIKALSPWYSHDKNLSTADNVSRFIERRGIPTPPLHGHCRSSLLVM